MLATDVTPQTGLAFHARISKMPPIMKKAMPNTSSTPQTASDDLERIDTRFGMIEVNRSSALVFEHGLLGVPQSNVYALVEFPSDNLGNFRLLQSLDERDLSFITLPIDLDNPIIERGDLEKAASDIGIAAGNMAALLIVSVHRSPTDLKLSVNARAPLLVDVTNRYAMQYVFQHSRYKVQHLLDMPPTQGND